MRDRRSSDWCSVRLSFQDVYKRQVVTGIEDENVLVDARTFEMEYASEFVRMLKEAEIFSGKMCAEEER